MDEVAKAPEEMLATLGLRRRDAFGAGRCTLVFEAGMHMCHSGGVVQGGFVTGWLDAAMAHAFFSLGQPGLVPMSLEIKVSFFAPARPGLVFAEGWIERQGKSTCFAEAQLKDSHGNVIAKATSTMRLVSQAKVADGSRAAVGG
jgi:acyl-CoA thioesterase